MTPAASQAADEATVQQEATTLLTDYSNADPDVRLAIPPTVPTTLSEIQTAAKTNVATTFEHKSNLRIP